MSYKVCYVTTLARTLREFIQPSAEYQLQHTDWEITFISAPDPEIEDGFPESVRFLPIHIKRGISLSGIRSTVELYRIFRKEHFDLVQYTTANAGFYASIAAKLARVPIRIYAQWGIGYVYLHGLGHFLKRLMERVICGSSTHIQPDSRENLEIVVKDKLYPALKGSVIANGSACGVDLTKYDIANKDAWREEIRRKYHLEEGAFVFGYVGRMLRDKGLNELFSAFRKVAETRGDVFLMMVGGTSIVEGIDPHLWQWANESPRVIFSGYTTDTEKYYAAMDTFVFPSYHEGFGSVSIEAGAMGVPAIVTDIPGSREAVKKDLTGLLVPVRDADALQNAMVRMLSDGGVREAFGKNAVEHVKENYDRDYVCRRILENRAALFEELHKGAKS